MTIQMPSSEPRSRGTIRVVRSIATSRPGLIAIAAAVIGSGLALNWTSLVALGAAPLILGILPCAAMCAVGLCMPMGGSKKVTPVDDLTSHSISRGDAPLVIEGTARAQTAPSRSSFGSSPTP